MGPKVKITSLSAHTQSVIEMTTSKRLLRNEEMITEMKQRK